MPPGAKNAATFGSEKWFESAMRLREDYVFSCQVKGTVDGYLRLTVTAQNGE